MNIPGYDEWKLAGPDDSDSIGTEEGDICNRVAEPDEDAPRGYRPKPCRGTMMLGQVTYMDKIICDTCGEARNDQ